MNSGTYKDGNRNIFGETAQLAGYAVFLFCRFGLFSLLILFVIVREHLHAYMECCAKDYSSIDYYIFSGISNPCVRRDRFSIETESRRAISIPRQHQEHADFAVGRVFRGHQPAAVHFIVERHHPAVQHLHGSAIEESVM